MNHTIQNSITDILKAIGEDPNREGLLKTPQRVEKSFEFLCSGYKQDPESILNDALFETNNSQMVLVRDIEFYSLCEHHLLPFFGRVTIGYIPNGKVVGLSKLPRLVDVFARRLQIQEQMTEQIADAIMHAIKPQGVGIMATARHLCMEMRGVEKRCSITTTSALRGVFYQSKVREEFLSIANSQSPNRY
ncbi:MAG: cyclohydrolase [Pseudomonadota bacterium]|jgi:GTP cyclohydrolase I